jgi:hypothetical protein
MAAIRPRPSTAPGYKRRYPERDEQIALFRWIDAHTRLHPSLGTVFAIPNGLALLPGVAGQARAQGVRSGVWDICVPVARRKQPESEPVVWQSCDIPVSISAEIHGGRSYWCALWIEMKAGKNRLTPEQAEFKESLRRHSPFSCEPQFVVCRSWIEAASAICDYLDIRDAVIREGLK